MNTEKLTEKISEGICGRLNPSIVLEPKSAMSDAAEILKANRITPDFDGFFIVNIKPITLEGVIMLADARRLTKLYLTRAGKFYLRFDGTSVFTPLVHFPSKRHRLGTLRIVKRSDKQRSVYIIKF